MDWHNYHCATAWCAWLHGLGSTNKQRFWNQHVLGKAFMPQILGYFALLMFFGMSEKLIRFNICGWTCKVTMAMCWENEHALRMGWHCKSAFLKPWSNVWYGSMDIYVNWRIINKYFIYAFIERWSTYPRNSPIKSITTCYPLPGNNPDEILRHLAKLISNGVRDLSTSPGVSQGWQHDVLFLWMFFLVMRYWIKLLSLWQNGTWPECKKKHPDSIL